MAPTSTRSSRPLFAGAVALAAAAHLLVGYLYLVSGLVVPGPALLPLWLWWAVLTALMGRWALARSWWAVLVPVVALATWTGVLVIGDAFLGWTA